MSELKSKYLLHLLLIFLFIVIIILLLVVPSNAIGRPIVVIKHHQKHSVPLSQQYRSAHDYAERAAKRNVIEAQRVKDRASVPQGEWQTTSNEWNKWVAENTLREAERTLKSVQADRYFEQRIQESQKRDVQILMQKKEQKQSRKRILREPAFP